MDSSGAMLWGGAAYNNGIVPLKNYIFGEAYTESGQPAKVVAPGNPPGQITSRQAARGALGALYPLPRWNVVPPGDEVKWTHPPFAGEIAAGDRLGAQIDRESRQIGRAHV